MNKAILIGRLTAEPELQTTNNGVSVCRFSLAVNRPYRNENAETQADFLNIVAWRNLADNCQKYLSKGKQCAVMGAIQTRSYEDSNGIKRYVTEIIADNVEFLGGSQSNEQVQAKPKVNELEPIEDDDLPF